jgi:hypothetical protein
VYKDVYLPVISVVNEERTRTTALPFVLGDLGSEGSRPCILGGGLMGSGGAMDEMGRGRGGSLTGRSVE